MRKGFTLIELMIVVLVIGIMVTFAVPQFRVTQERALDREARSVLLLIQAAERTFRMEEGTWFPPNGIENDIADLNEELRLNLSASSAWSYGVNSAIQRITATRNRPGGRTLRANFTTETVTCVSGASDACIP